MKVQVVDLDAVFGLGGLVFLHDATAKAVVQQC